MITTQPAIDLADYEPLILKMSLKCRRKLPPSTIQDLDDLRQEGRKHALYVARKFDPARGVKFLTLLTIGLTHRYGRILHEEWKRAFTSGPDALETAAEPASQGVVDAVLALRIQLLDRYRKLRCPHLRVAYRGAVAVMPAAVAAELPARFQAEIIRYETRRQRRRRRLRPAPRIYPRLTS